MLITGAGYAIIGIKHQWLSTFLSAAYLAALGVTVLIIYVMSPPVSDAIQGAYMVAALMTGLIFGGICLVFKDVAEGLGCLLGGFCIAMWFLVLSPGGLLKDTTQKAIFIGVFSAVGWSLSFSQHTRNYGLILCTAFAGSTITILGIDCFSRAGLKEFWIYIWGKCYVDLASRVILTVASAQRERISLTYHHLPDYTRHPCRDCRYHDSILVQHHVPDQDLEDRERS